MKKGKNKKTLGFKRWIKENSSSIDIEISETGADKELDFDREQEYQDRFNKYLANIFLEEILKHFQ